MKRNVLILIGVMLFLLPPLCLAGDNITYKIYGLDNEAAIENIKSRLTNLADEYDTKHSINALHTFYKKVPNNVKKALAPFGYFKANASTRLESRNNHWTIYIFIHPGPPLIINHFYLTITGPGEYENELTKLRKKFPIKAGQIFNTAEYEKAKSLILQTANNAGYVKAHFVHKEVAINLRNYTCEINLHVYTGSRFYFGDIQIHDGPLDPNFLKRLISFKEGEPFSSKTLFDAQQDISGTSYFKDVVITPQMNEEKDNKIPVDIYTTLRKARQYNVGLGYGTFTGPRLTLGLDLRRVTNTGQSFNAELRYSNILKILAAKYYIPGRNPLRENYTIGANIKQFMPKNGRSTSKTLSFAYNYSGKEWHSALSLNYLSELSEADGNPSVTNHVIYPSLTLSRIKTDNVLRPEFGHSVSLMVRGAYDDVLSSTTFIQTEAKAKLIITPIEKTHIIGRGDLGYTVVKEFKKFPLTLNFFAGGIDSIRGYPFSGLGPARYLEVGSIEFQRDITSTWTLAAFYDIGTATNDFNNNFAHSEGLGIIYNSVVGPIKIYLAHANNQRPPGKRLAIEFSIGPDF